MCENMSTIFKLQYRDIRTSILLGVTPSSHFYLMRHLENPWLIAFEYCRSFWLQDHSLIWIMYKKNGDIPHAAEYGMFPEARWNKPDWLKIWLPQSDPHSVMPLIKLIIGASVPSANCTCAHIQMHTHTHTNLVLLIETAFSLLSLCCLSLQLVEPHFELPQALSLLSLGGWDRGAQEKQWEEGWTWKTGGKWKTNMFRTKEGARWGKRWLTREMKAQLMK